MDIFVRCELQQHMKLACDITKGQCAWLYLRPLVVVTWEVDFAHQPWTSSRCPLKTFSTIHNECCATLVVLLACPGKVTQRELSGLLEGHIPQHETCSCDPCLTAFRHLAACKLKDSTRLNSMETLGHDSVVIHSNFLRLRARELLLSSNLIAAI